jgi:hypothetical protein
MCLYGDDDKLEKSPLLFFSLLSSLDFFFWSVQWRFIVRLSWFRVAQEAAVYEVRRFNEVVGYDG